MSVIISADSHVLEPADLWEKVLGRRYGDKVPHLVQHFDGYDGAFFYLGREGEAARADEMVNATTDDQRLNDLTRAGKDPGFRLDLIKADGVLAEVLNPTWALWVPRIPSGEIRRACSEVFNDWIIDFCSENPRRLIGVGLVPIDDVNWAAKEARRVLRKGLRGIMVPVQPIEGAPPYRDLVYDPFWAVIEEAGVPLTLHIVTGRVRDPFTYHGAKERGEVPRSFIDLFAEAAPVLASEFIFGGIFDRFPHLKVFLSEYDASWLPIFKYRVDRIETFPGLRSLKRRARAYVDENIFIGIINDPLASKLRYEIGIDRIMWGSDFPHPPCPYPRTRERIGEILNGISESERAAIVAENVSRLYGIDVKDLAS